MPSTISLIKFFKNINAKRAPSGSDKADTKV